MNIIVAGTSMAITMLQKMMPSEKQGSYPGTASGCFSVFIFFRCFFIFCFFNFIFCVETILLLGFCLSIPNVVAQGAKIEVDSMLAISLVANCFFVHK